MVISYLFSNELYLPRYRWPSYVFDPNEVSATLSLKLAKTAGSKHIICYYGISPNQFDYTAPEKTLPYQENFEKLSAQTVSKIYAASFAKALEEAQIDIHLPATDRMQSRRNLRRSVPNTSKKRAAHINSAIGSDVGPAAKKKRTAPKAKPAAKPKVNTKTVSTADEQEEEEEEEESYVREDEEDAVVVEEEEEEAEFDELDPDDEEEYAPEKKKEAKKKVACTHM